MHDTGLQEVPNPSAALISQRSTAAGTPTRLPAGVEIVPLAADHGQLHVPKVSGTATTTGP